MEIASLIVCWIGHACLWCRLLNYLYGCPLSKRFLRPWRLLTGLIIVAPLVIAVVGIDDAAMAKQMQRLPHDLRSVIVILMIFALLGYGSLCLTIGGMIFPIISIVRLWDRRFDRGHARRCRSTIRSFWPLHGSQLIGDGPWRRLARLPGNDIFNVETTDLKLAFPAVSLEGWDGLPPELRHRPPLPSALEGLTILFLTDFHFVGTPSKLYYETILEDIESQPTPDIVVLGGDYVDSVDHHSWIAPLLGRLKWREAGIAILGNHDLHYQPDAIRNELASVGFTVLSNQWQTMTIRGVPINFIGHEGPWFQPTPDLAGMPREPLTICVCHTPDNFNWCVNWCVDLVLAGHVHGGQIRVPGIGSIFIPSKYGRRFDQGVFKISEVSDAGERINFRTTMVVSRGLSGKEPIRFRCPPQVVRITLTGEPEA